MPAPLPEPFLRSGRSPAAPTACGAASPALVGAPRAAAAVGVAPSPRPPVPALAPDCDVDRPAAFRALLGACAPEPARASSPPASPPLNCRAEPMADASARWISAGGSCCVLDDARGRLGGATVAAVGNAAAAAAAAASSCCCSSPWSSSVSKRYARVGCRAVGLDGGDTSSSSLLAFVTAARRCCVARGAILGRTPGFCKPIRSTAGNASRS